MTPNYARDFNFEPWVDAGAAVMPQVYGNERDAYTVYNGIETMKKSGVPESLLSLTLGVYPVSGTPVPWDDYRTWRSQRGIYLGERLDANLYSNLSR